MRAKLILAESAVQHQDGTFSLLRGGINALWGLNPPVPLKGAIVIRIESQLGDGGEHTFDLRCMDTDGKEVLPAISGTLQLHNRPVEQTLILNFQVAFPYGDLSFVLRIDNQEKDTWRLRVAQGPPPAPGEEQR